MTPSRLVRVLCTDCRRMAPVSDYERQLLKLTPDAEAEIGHPVGCDACGNSGYRGRTGIYELVPVDDRMRSMIHAGVSEQELETYARTLSPSIAADGRRKVMEGITTLEEVVRVTRED